MTAAERSCPARSAADCGLAEDMGRVLALFADAPAGMIVTEGPDHVVAMMNAAYAGWIGHRDVIGRPARDAFPNMEELGFHRLMDEAFATGEARLVRNARTLVQEGEAGVGREAFVNFVLQPIRDSRGRVSGLLVRGRT